MMTALRTIQGTVMRGRNNQFQIFWTVVVLHGIAMVNLLVRLKIAPKFFLHNKSMLGDVTATADARMIAGQDVNIASMSIAPEDIAYPCGGGNGIGAGLRTIGAAFVFGCVDQISRSLKGLSAICANPVDSLALAFGETIARAKLVNFEADVVGFAVRTKSIHAAILARQCMNVQQQMEIEP